MGHREVLERRIGRASRTILDARESLVDTHLMPGPRTDEDLARFRKVVLDEVNDLKEIVVGFLDAIEERVMAGAMNELWADAIADRLIERLGDQAAAGRDLAEQPAAVSG